MSITIKGSALGDRQQQPGPGVSPLGAGSRLLPEPPASSRAYRDRRLSLHHRSPESQRQPAVPVAPATEQFWDYCESSRAYYPSVQTCAEPWIKVPPRAQ
jgi:hypothetical protein